MRDLPIELLGAPCLREHALEVEHFDDELRELVQAMFRTMYRAQGQGLAGPQVGVMKRIFIVDMPEDDSPAFALVNPVIVERGTKKQKFEEGCLSIPGVTAPVERHTHVVVEAFDPEGKPVRIEADDALADCLQHELDHLDGVLYIDHLSHLQRQLLLKKYKKLSARREA